MTKKKAKETNEINIQIVQKFINEKSAQLEAASQVMVALTEDKKK